MKKKIAFVNKALWYGGIETALITLLNRMDYEKYDVTLILFRAVFDFDLKDRINKHCRLIVLDRDKTATFETRYKYSKLYHFTEPCENPSWRHKMILWVVPSVKWLENELYIKYAKKMLENEQFNTVVIYSDVVGEIATRSIKADKYLMFYHHGAMRHVYHDKIAYKRCKKIIAVSENQAEELRKFVPSAAHKIITIHNLIDIEGIRKKAAEDTAETFDKTKFNIVTVGRVSHEKGMDIAVQACAKLVEQGFENICWWIVGDGPAMPKVRAIVNEMDMDSYIKLVGMKSNPYPYVRQADLYVQPSRFEGYPMSILEAIILKKIVISTNNKGAEEMLKNLKCGILCQIDSADFAEKISGIISDSQYYEEKKQEMGKIDLMQKNKEILNQIETLL